MEKPVQWCARLLTKTVASSGLPSATTERPCLCPSQTLADDKQGHEQGPWDGHGGSDDIELRAFTPPPDAQHIQQRRGVKQNGSDCWVDPCVHDRDCVAECRHEDQNRPAPEADDRQHYRPPADRRLWTNRGSCTAGRGGIRNPVVSPRNPI